MNNNEIQIARANLVYKIYDILEAMQKDSSPISDAIRNDQNSLGATLWNAVIHHPDEDAMYSTSDLSTIAANLESDTSIFEAALLQSLKRRPEDRDKSNFLTCLESVVISTMQQLSDQ